MDLTQDEIIEKLDSGEIRIFEIEKYTKTANEAADIRRKYIEIKYPKIKVYYQDVEEGCEYYFSNDVNHKYFSEYAFIQSDDGSYVVYSETELKEKIKELKNPEYHLFKYEED